MNETNRTAIILLAALQDVPKSLQEAAMVDGAGAFQRFGNVTLPSIMPVMGSVAILSSIGAFRVFVPMYVLTQGGPAHSTRTLALHAYEAAFTNGQIGYSAAISFVLMAVIIVVASWWLARLCDVLSAHRIELIGRPLGATFVGAFFLALATSLPEIVTSISAVRLGNLDLALGNIFGSNMFNIFVIPFLKVVSVTKGDTLLLGARALDGTQNLIAGLLAILLTAIAVGGLAYKGKREVPRHFGFDSILIAVTYLGGMALLLMGSD